MSSTLTLIISWICTAISYGTVMMFGSLGETLTEKSGHLNLGVPGMVYIGGFAAFAASFLYENGTTTPNTFLLLFIPVAVGFTAAACAGLIYAFLTITLKANQNVSGLALTAFGVGLGAFGGSYILKSAGYGSYATASATYKVISSNIASLIDTSNSSPFVQAIVKVLFSYGFMVYLAIIIAVILHLFLFKTRQGLNLRAIGENPATADAAGINVTRYKYLATVLGGGLCGLGGMYLIMDYSMAGWTTSNSLESLGWLSVALVIFSTWKPLNTIWGSYLFALLFWLYNYFPGLTNIKIATWQTDILKAIPYLVTILTLIISNLRKKKENQPPASLGLSYFREDR